MIAYHTTAHFVHDAATGLPLPDLARFGRIQYLKQLNNAGRWVPVYCHEAAAQKLCLAALRVLAAADPVAVHRRPSQDALHFTCHSTPHLLQ